MSKLQARKSSSVCVTKLLLGTIVSVRPYGSTYRHSAAVIIVFPAPVAISCRLCGASKNLLIVSTW